MILWMRPMPLAAASLASSLTQFHNVCCQADVSSGNQQSVGTQYLRLSATIFAFVTDTKQARRFLVSGFVQGVGFRYFAQYTAQRLHVSGYVRNLRDGRVEAYAVGTPEQLADFRKALERGPASAEVTAVLEEPAATDSQHADAFVISYDD
jgi:acylphosphatase